MKWVEISRTHINTNNIECFFWYDGQLKIYWAGTPNDSSIPDPDKKHYLKLCRSVGVRPYEEEDDGN